MENEYDGYVEKRKSRFWFFTFNNPETLPDLVHPLVNYAVYQEEIGPDTGNYHLQGYIEFKRTMRLAAVVSLNNNSLFGARLAIREARNSEDARNYCKDPEKRMPGGILYEIGKPVKQGERMDLRRFTDDI